MSDVIAEGILKAVMYVGFGYAAVSLGFWLLGHFVGWFFGEKDDCDI